MIKVSDSAKDQALKLMSEQNLNNAFNRVGVKGGGCSGLSYLMDFDTELKDDDKVFEDKGLIHQINDGVGVAKYAISDENAKGKYGTDLHMHFHCTDCRKTICLPNKISEESLPDDYEVNDVNLVLKGICEKCRKK